MDEADGVETADHDRYCVMRLAYPREQSVYENIRRRVFGRFL